MSEKIFKTGAGELGWGGVGGGVLHPIPLLLLKCVLFQLYS